MAVCSAYEAEIRKAIKTGEPAVFRTGFLSHEATECILEAMNLMLAELGKPHLREAVGYFVREFLSNANKSNLKRVHYRILGLDMNNADQYAQGMKSFGKDFREKLAEYGAELEKLHMYTEAVYRVAENRLVIIVKNSNLPTIQETLKAHNLIEKSKMIHDTAEAFMTLGDTSEGAGLGMVSTILMLRSLGLSEKDFKFYSDQDNKETVVKVEIPLDTVTEVQMEEISGVIAMEIDSIPTFPDNISELEHLLSSDEVPFSQVAEVIQKDVAITAEILKIVNSAQYMLPQKVASIQNAVSLIGLKGLRNLLISYGAQSLIKSMYGKMDPIWEHSYRCASYAFYLAKEYKMAALADDAYICGILHDIGKIVVYTTNPGLLEKINSYCGAKGIGGNIIENLAIGASHAKIGSEITHKWNFPGQITAVLEYHHKPLLAPEEFLDLTALVYAANQLTHIHDKNYAFSALEKTIFEKFGVKEEKELFALEKKLDDLYQTQKKK